MSKLSDMDQMKNHNCSAVYGQGFPISNGQTFKESLQEAIANHFYAWGNHEVLSVEFEPTITGAVAFTATMNKDRGKRLRLDKLPIRGIATTHTTVSHQHGAEIDFHSYILVYWEMNDCAPGECISSIPAGQDMHIDYAPCTRCNYTVDRRG